MPLYLALRTAGPVALAVLGALAIDRMAARQRLDPPGFAQPWRRGLAMAVVAFVLWVGVFAPLGGGEPPREADFSSVSTPYLFLLHGLLAAVLAAWYLLGFAGFGGAEPGLGWRAQLGFRTPRPWRELGLGALIGAATWSLLIGLIYLFAVVVSLFVGDEWLPKSPPPMIHWIVGLPAATRLLVSLSAGLVEEAFFRGFLQPRVGVWLSGSFFVLAHLSYGQPILLVGVTLLSVLYALLVRWRQNILPGVAAHAVFDAVQLLIIVPAVLRLFGKP